MRHGRTAIPGKTELECLPMIHVRRATPEDAAGVTAVHRAGVPEWYRYLPSGQKVRSEYEELSVRDRWRAGGPHMSVETSAAHLTGLLSVRQSAWVAVDASGTVVGELEAYDGREADWGRTTHVDMLEVHPAFRRHGVGRALIGAAVDHAGTQRSEIISANADRAAEAFYRHVGLDQPLARVRDGSLATDVDEAHDAPSIELMALDSYALLERRRFVLGRMQAGCAVWSKRRWRLPGVTDDLPYEEGRIEKLDTYYRLEMSAAERGRANAFAWTSVPGRIREIILSLVRRARELGYRSLWLAADRSARPVLAGIPVQWGAEYLFLGRRLRIDRPESAGSRG